MLRVTGKLPVAGKLGLHINACFAAIVCKF